MVAVTLRRAIALAATALLAAPAMAGDNPKRLDPLAPAASAEAGITIMGRRALPANPDVLGTAAVNAGVTLYDARFRRVAAADRDHPKVRAIAAQLQGLDPVAQLNRVKALVGRQVRYGDDLETLHVSDYWSNAGETLDRGVGDDEDIAIVEMQALKAAGFNPADLYISVGRDKLRGMHSVLIARTAQGFYLLDDAEAGVVPASSAGRFVPMMTIGAGRSFLHGYRTAAIRH